MLKFYLKKSIFLLIFILAATGTAFAEDEGGNSSESVMEKKARQAHELASSDMIHGNENWVALYFQNQEIIKLLKQIRDSLDVIKSQGSKDDAAEKSG